jgi:hypothetical protein
MEGWIQIPSATLFFHARLALDIACQAARITREIPVFFVTLRIHVKLLPSTKTFSFSLIDFSGNEIIPRDGKGSKDRIPGASVVGTTLASSSAAARRSERP